MPLLPPQIPYGLNWNETRAFVVRGLWRHDSPSHSHQIESAVTWLHVKHILTTNHLSCALNISIGPRPLLHTIRFSIVIPQGILCKLLRSWAISYVFGLWRIQQSWRADLNCTWGGQDSSVHFVSFVCQSAIAIPLLALWPNTSPAMN